MIDNKFNKEDINLRDGEHLVSVMRKHWFVFFMHVLPLKILFVLPLIFLIVALSMSLNQTTIVIIIFFSSLWMLVLLMAIFTIWTNYFLDIWIVTNQRIIDIEQRHLFNREIRTLRMETVQDVHVDKVNFFQEFFNFGTLRVQTAGTGGTDALIEGIPNPEHEQELIMEEVHIINTKSNVTHSGEKLSSPHTT